VLHDDDAVVEFEEVGLGLVVGVEVPLIEGGGDGLLAAARLRARGGLLVRGLFRGQVVLVVLHFDFEAVFAGGRVQPSVVAQFDLGPLEVELVVGGRLLGRGLGSASQGELVEGGVHLILVLREGRLGSGQAEDVRLVLSRSRGVVREGSLRVGIEDLRVVEFALVDG
jgi:hypothetical protein